MQIKERVVCSGEGGGGGSMLKEEEEEELLYVSGAAGAIGGPTEPRPKSTPLLMTEGRLLHVLQL